jgi:carboxypeptidase Taq
LFYQKLEAHYRKLSHLDQLSAVLDWDQAVIMPDGAGGARADAGATLKGIRHGLATAPELEDWLGTAEDEARRGDLQQWQQANLREMSRAYRRAVAVPRDLVEASSAAEARSEQAWRVLRAKNDWASFVPHLSEVVALKRQSAAALSDALGLDPYDALLDEFEPGLTSDVVSTVFGRLREFLPGFLGRALECQAREAVHTPQGPFSVALQKQLGEELMVAIGFDRGAGRLDVSHHPFCGGVPRDVRITTRYDESDFTSSLAGDRCLLGQRSHADRRRDHATGVTNVRHQEADRIAADASVPAGCRPGRRGRSRHLHLSR